MELPFIPVKVKRLKLPFVTRAKYERMKQDCRDYRAACDYKQTILMHYRGKYTRLWNLINQPRDRGRFAKKNEAGLNIVGVLSPSNDHRSQPGRGDVS